MQRHIWKYIFEDMNEVLHFIPKDSQILSAQAKDDVVTMWVKVDPNSPKVPRVFQIIGGQVFDDHRLNFISTVQIGWLTCHLFEKV